MPENPLVLILDQVEKPGNIGAIFRSADAADVDAVLLCESGDAFNPNAIRSSLGAVFHVACASGSEVELADFLVRHHVHVLAARVESSDSLWTTDLRRPTAIILGSEAEGIGNRWQEINGEPVQGIHIPIAGNVDSLNAANSAAVIAYEARRQRTSSTT